MPTATLPSLVCLLCGVALFCASANLARVRPLPRPTLGPRGLARTRGLQRPGVTLVEPVLRWLAALVARIPCAALRARITLRLEMAGEPFGLCADECLVLCCAALTGGGVLAAAVGLGAPAVLATSCGSAFAPLIDLHERARARQREVARRLPAAIDLMALCMGAGLDFKGALELVASELRGANDALCAELQRLVQELALGRTRARVLAELAERVPTPAVHDFAHAVVQAEQRGNPLAEVLDVQARVLRMRRSIAAEEAAARASVLMLLPLLLLLSAVLLLLFGPFLVNGVGL